MSGTRTLVVFSLGDSRYALPLETVERVLPVAAITPLPKAPQIVLGVVDVGGHIIPVLDLRTRFGLPPREIELDDQLIVARASGWTVALWVDCVSGVADRAESEIVVAPAVVPGLEYLEGIVKLEDGLVLVHDLDTFLALDEQRALGTALETKALAQ